MAADKKGGKQLAGLKKNKVKAKQHKMFTLTFSLIAESHG